MCLRGLTFSYFIICIYRSEIWLAGSREAAILIIMEP
jgi:hypothetical protein